MSRNANHESSTVAEKLHDLPALESVLQRAARVAIRRHALSGIPIAVWRDGGLVVEVPTLDDFPPEGDAP